jgi:hypothetical protein
MNVAPIYLDMISHRVLSAQPAWPWPGRLVAPARYLAVDPYLDSAGPFKIRRQERPLAMARDTGGEQAGKGKGGGERDTTEIWQILGPADGAVLDLNYVGRDNPCNGFCFFLRQCACLSCKMECSRMRIGGNKSNEKYTR